MTHITRPYDGQSPRTVSRAGSGYLFAAVVVGGLVVVTYLARWLGEGVWAVWGS